MAIFLNVIAIVLEVSILAAIVGCMLAGAGLAIFDLGINARYKKMVAIALLLVGGAVVIFFIAHLTSFYPTV